MKWVSGYSRIVWFLLTIAAMVFMYYLPFEKLDRLGKLLETSGGKVLVLSIMTMLFFIAAMSFMYYTLDAIQGKTLQPDDVMVNMAMQFCTGGAFGTVLGALITMTGGNHRNNGK